jgi:hypothetical protein
LYDKPRPQGYFVAVCTLLGVGACMVLGGEERSRRGVLVAHLVRDDPAPLEPHAQVGGLTLARALAPSDVEPMIAQGRGRRQRTRAGR